jgi:hypothetical protein
MRARSCAAFLLLVLATFACATSWDDDSHYVPLGPRNGYFIVRPDSHLFYQLGLYEAPVIDTADPLRHGYGADALAFRFNRNGVLVAPPAYIAQALPYDFYKYRIASLTRGRATVDDVEALFGRGHSRADRLDGFMWYYSLPVHNPFEEWGGRR